MKKDNADDLVAALADRIEDQVQHSSTRQVFFVMACVALHELYDLEDDIQSVDRLIEDIVDNAKKRKSALIH